MDTETTSKPTPWQTFASFIAKYANRTGWYTVTVLSIIQLAGLHEDLNRLAYAFGEATQWFLHPTMQRMLARVEPGYLNAWLILILLAGRVTIHLKFLDLLMLLWHQAKKAQQRARAIRFALIRSAMETLNYAKEQYRIYSDMYRDRFNEKRRVKREKEIRQAMTKGAADMQAWTNRRDAAQAAGLAFDEPPPHI